MVRAREARANTLLRLGRADSCADEGSTCPELCEVGELCTLPGGGAGDWGICRDCASGPVCVELDVLCATPVRE